MYLHHFNPLLALSCQPQVLHSVSGDCIPVRAGRAKASLDVLLHLSHLLLWARLQLHMGREAAVREPGTFDVQSPGPADCISGFSARAGSQPRYQEQTSR